MLSNTDSLWDFSTRVEDNKDSIIIIFILFLGILVKDKESCGGVGHGLDFGGWVGSDVLGLDWDKESLNFLFGLS